MFPQAEMLTAFVQIPASALKHPSGPKVNFCELMEYRPLASAGQRNNVNENGSESRSDCHWPHGRPRRQME
jgi:hypothetical protein